MKALFGIPYKSYTKSSFEMAIVPNNQIWLGTKSFVRLLAPAPQIESTNQLAFLYLFDVEALDKNNPSLDNCMHLSSAKILSFFRPCVWTNNTLPNNNTYAQSIEQKSAPDTLPSSLLHYMLSDIYKKQYFRQYFRYQKPRPLRTSTSQPYNPSPRVEAKFVAREPDEPLRT